MAESQKLTTELEALSRDVRGRAESIDRIGRGVEQVGIASNDLATQTLPNLNRVLAKLERATENLNRAIEAQARDPRSLLFGAAPPSRPGRGGLQGPAAGRHAMRCEQRLVVMTVGALALAACSLGPGPRAPLARYDLGAAPAGPAREAVRLPFLFIVHEASGPLWLDSGDMIYRLAYDEPERLRRYANSQWAVSPLTLVGERLRARLAARSERGGGLPDLGIPADYWVRVAVEEFGQVFDGPGVSRGVVRLRIVLVRARATPSSRSRTLPAACRPPPGRARRRECTLARAG